MDPNNVSNDDNQILKHKPKFNLSDIKSVIIFKKIFNYIQKAKMLGIIKYNKIMKNKLNINMHIQKFIIFSCNEFIFLFIEF